jgi:hypothetical protein
VETKFGDVTFPAKEVKPGAKVTIEAPGMGKSASSRGKTVAKVCATFPKDWDPQRAHPVFVQLRGGYGGWKVKEPWLEIFGEHGWITLGVDYNNDFVYPSGMPHAQAALEGLRGCATLAEDSIVVGGDSSGAYSICNCLNHERYRDFDAFMIVIGGMENGNSARGIGNRPVLVVEGENDTAKRRRMVAGLLQSLGRSNVTHYVMEGVGHKWPPREHATKSDKEVLAETVETIRSWLKKEIPAMQALAEAEEDFLNSRSIKQQAELAGKITSLGYPVFVSAEVRERMETLGPALALTLGQTEEKQFHYEAALEHYAKAMEGSSKAAAEAGRDRILERREQLIDRAKGLKESDPAGARELLEKIVEVFGEANAGEAATLLKSL